MFKIGLTVGFCLILFLSLPVLAGTEQRMATDKAEDKADTQSNLIHQFQANAGSQKEMIACTEPRPQVCTQDYRPVCAELQNGDFKTFSNGCTACSDPAVTGFRNGACE